MRRSAFSSILCTAAAFAGAIGILAGCEDGPNQSYGPAPGGAGQVWNNGDSPAAVNNAGAGFGGTYGGGSKTEICAGAELQSQWSKMIAQPIQPPYRMAGLDVSGGSTYVGLTFESAENGPTSPVMGAMDPPTRLCQPGAVLGTGGNASDVGGSLVVAWGNNQEVQMEWAIPTHKAYVMTLNPGYNGQMTWTATTFKNSDCALNAQAAHYQCCTAGNGGTPACDGMPHTWIWQIGHPMTKDGKPFIVRWPGYTETKDVDADTDEIYRGLAATFAPEIFDNAVPGITCISTGTCLVSATGNDGIHPIIGFRPVSMYFNLYPPSFPQPSGSTVQSAYFFNIKYAPYSPSLTTIKMFDPIGPTGTITFNGSTYMPGLQPCALQLGGTFKDLMSNCVNVFKDGATDTVAKAKVLGNLTHDDQNFTFSVVGDNQNYYPPELQLGGTRQFDVIHDGETPADNAVAGDFQFDVRSFGPIANDTFTTTTSGVTLYHKDRHGSAHVWREWGRAVQADLASAYHALHPTVPLRTYHDPACYFPMSCQGGAACNGLTFGACGGVAGCGWNYNFAPGQTVYSWRPAEGCTGFEGHITNAYPNVNSQTGLQAAADPNVIDPDEAAWDFSGGLGGLSGGFKPGNPFAVFCNDPGITNFCGLSGDVLGTFNTLFDAALSRVISFLGNGDILQVPPEGRDLRYYFKQFTIAFAKYAASPANPAHGPNAPSVAGGQNVNDAVPFFGDYVLDTDNLIFDSIGGNGARSEYVDFDNAGSASAANAEPTDLELQFLLIGSNYRSVNFLRRLDREERALFDIMATDKTQGGWGYLHDAQAKVVNDSFGYPQKNAVMNLSNLAGSPAIAAATNPFSGGPAWVPATDANGKFLVADATKTDPCFPNLPLSKTTQYCATHIDTDCQAAGSLNPPLDDNGNIITRDNGKPLLADYCGIWYPSPLALTGPGNPSALQLTETDPLIEEAKVTLPNYANPYDSTSKPGTPIQTLVPWKPFQEGVGFPVMVSGTSDVFVETAQLDFAGQVVTPVMDYLPMTVTPDGGAPYTALQVLAYETEDFLGDVFVCYDTVSAANRAGTGRAGDILGVHMYTSGQSILDWMASHPSAQDNCGIIVRYSPYNNYPDYIQGTSNGVRMSIDQSSGYGRVVDVTVFAPGQGTPAPP
jgi:hypothetical protein